MNQREFRWYLYDRDRAFTSERVFSPAMAGSLAKGDNFRANKVLMLAHSGKLAKRMLVAIGMLAAVLAAVFLWYANDYYRADSAALAVVADENGSADGVVVRELPDGSLVFEPEHPQMGLVFYPGGKVEPEAYAPLLERCAKQGVLGVLVRPPFNLAILNENMADGVQDRFPQIATWVIAGHSLGGVAAANYLSRHEGSFAGIALMASYPTCDLSDYGGSMVSIRGSNDGVLNREAYGNAHDKLPATSSELVIDGGNHSYYGNYGDQAGDGVATISRDAQQDQSVDAIVTLAHAKSQ